MKTNPAAGEFAIYEIPSRTSSDNSPLTDPNGNRSRLVVHSRDYLPSTTPALTQSVAITIPAQAANIKFGYSSPLVFNLFAHGLGDACMVEGRILDLNGAGNHVWFNGSVPVWSDAKGFATWLALGANNTHVVAVAWGITEASSPRAAQPLTIEASAYDFLASGSPVTGNPALPLIRNFPGSYTQFGRGKIDTRRRYLRKKGSGAMGAMSLNETLTMVGDGGGPYVQNSVGYRWRYSCGGYTKQTTVAWDGTATNGGTHDATTVPVTR